MCDKFSKREKIIKGALKAHHQDLRLERIGEEVPKFMKKKGTYKNIQVKRTVSSDIGKLKEEESCRITTQERSIP